MEQTFNEVYTNYKRHIQVLANSFGQKESAVIADLQQEGQIALWKAYKRFNQDKGYFPPYATRCISGAMKNYLTKNGRTIHIPAGVLLDKDKQHIVDDTRTTSINIPTNEYGGTVSDLIPELIEDPQIDVELFKTHLMRSVKKQKDLEIIKLRYGIDTYKALTYDQLCMIYDCSRQNIFTKISRTLKILKKNEVFRKIYS